MSLSRRRFLALSAATAAALLPGAAPAQVWSGRALGAEVQITLHGPPAVTARALPAALAVLGDIDTQFSLFERQSTLSRLNDERALEPVPPLFAALMARIGPLHRATEQLFDPTVQPLWRALADGGDTAAAAGLIGWHRVHASARRITLAPDQQLTLNGIAQGFATDRVRAVLADFGLTELLVNIGEFAGEGDFRIGVSDPVHGLVLTRPLTTGAIATSSPAALSLGRRQHILHPAGGAPLWSTVTVEAADATTADAASTALCLAPLAQVRRIKSALPAITRITLIDDSGNIRSL